MERKAVKAMDAAIKPQAINELQLIPCMQPWAALWPRLRENKSAISCCLTVGKGKLITEMHSLGPAGPEVFLVFSQFYV